MSCPSDHRGPQRPLLLIASLALALGCRGTAHRDDDAGVDGSDAALADARMEDAVVPSDGALDGAPGPDGAPVDAGREPGPVGRLVTTLALTRVDAFQGVAVPLARDGIAAPPPRPLVAARDAIVRVHAEALAGWSPRAVTAVIEIDGARFTDTRTPTLPADDARPESLFMVRVPAASVRPGARWRARLEAATGDGDDDAALARLPRDGGTAALDAERTTPLHLVLVPYRYDTDGSGRLPDTSEAQLGRIRAELTSRFPYADVVLEVHDVVPWTRATRFNNNVDWGAVNSSLIALRDAEGAAPHEYWYGLMAPHETRASYCRSTFGSCVTGQSYVATVTGTRVGSGVGFGDLDTIGTLAHELGHLHGRFHAPCGTSGTDAGYPHAGGVIGVWGYDRRDDTFHPPDGAWDLLGYCEPQWVSDYTWDAMFARQRDLRAAYALSAHAPTLHRFITRSPDGTTTSETLTLRRLPAAPQRGFLLDVRGLPFARVDVARLDVAHGGDVVYVLAEPTAAARSLVVDGHELPLHPAR
ncbi:MAG: hypothetical protein KF901_33260 [Myxococcales bacterium]|nr:hypothetical protein [Myxococcales bacterium]